ncbi:unnamed protein product, partial [Allacma fusca]
NGRWYRETTFSTSLQKSKPLQYQEISEVRARKIAGHHVMDAIDTIDLLPGVARRDGDSENKQLASGKDNLKEDSDLECLGLVGAAEDTSGECAESINFDLAASWNLIATAGL